jgi:hypothetical protein
MAGLSVTACWYNGYVKKVFCMFMRVQLVKYLGTSQVDFCLYSI